MRKPAIEESRERLGEPMDRERFILYMWLMFLRAPGRDTLPGERVDLGEIGHVKEKDWQRVTPYGPTKPSR